MILSKEKIKSVDLDLLVDQKIELNKSSDVLFIVPTNRKARNLKKEIISLSKNQSAALLKIETLGTISTKLLKESKPFHSLSEAAASVFIKQIVAQTKFCYLSLYRDEIPFGTLDKIKNVITEYKRQGITPGLLRLEAEKLELNEKRKAMDIADIYDKYKLKCKQLNAFDIGDIYEELNNLPVESFANNFRKLYNNTELILVNGFSEFTKPETKILNLISDFSNAQMFINLDYNARNIFIFSHLDKSYNNLTASGFTEVKEISPSELSNFVRIVRNNLFISKRNRQIKSYSGRIFKIEAHNKENEVELIAKEIKTILSQSETEPDKICVVFNLIQDYSSIVKDVFEKNGIPFNLTDRTPLQNSNSVTAVVNYLEIIENDFYFKNLFRALNSGFIDTSGIDTSNLYKVASELKIVSGKETWLNSLNDALLNILHSQDDETTANRKENYIKAYDDLSLIIDILKPFDEKLTISQFLARLKEFITKSKLPFKLLSGPKEQEQNVRAFTEFIETVTEVFELLEEEQGAEKKFPIGFFMDQIRTACSWARFNVKEKSNFGVLVTTPEEIRGLRFDYLFIGGLYDGNLPTRFYPEIFFSGSFKKQAFIHQTEERFLFYKSISAWKKRLYLTYPTNDEKKETVVSTFLKDFEEFFALTKKSESDFENTIFSKEELQIYTGTKFLQNETVEAIEDFDFEKIKKTLMAEKNRNDDPFAISVHNGDLLAIDIDDCDARVIPDITEQLKLYSSRSYSISQLETYAKCPFKFFVERILGIETIEEPTEDIEAIEMGRLLHTILYDFYSTLHDRNITLVDCDEKTFRIAVELIFEIAEKQLQNTAFKSPLTFYEKEKILGLTGNKSESVLYKFLETERNGDKEFIPKYFEVSFGSLKGEESDKILSSPGHIAIDGIKLRGIIDRIEVNETAAQFNIVDYKLSGNKPSFDDLKNGISLQLPVYLYAAAELLSKKFNRKYSPNEMFIYSLKYAIDDFGKDKISLGRKKDEELQNVEQLLQRTIVHIKNYIESISQGKFHLSKLEERENKVCRFCQFRTICRIDDTNL